MPNFKLVEIKPVRVSEEKMINFDDVTDYLGKEKILIIETCQVLKNGELKQKL